MVDETKDEGTSEADPGSVAPARRSMTDEEYRARAEMVREELEQSGLFEDEGTGEADPGSVARARRSMTDEEYRAQAEDVREELEQLFKDDDRQ